MQYYHNQLCVSFNELVDNAAMPNEVGNGVISLNDYRNYVKSSSKKLVPVRRGCRGKEALYSLDKAPAYLIEKVKRIYGPNISEQALQSPLLKLYEPDIKAFDFFFSYKLPNGKSLKEDKQKEYAVNASVLNAILTLLESNKITRKSKNSNTSTKYSYRDCIIPALQAFKGQWRHTLPLSESTLRDKIKKYQESGYESLISGKIANENAAKIVETEQHALLRKLLSHANNFDFAQVQMMYNEVAGHNGWKKVTRRTVEIFAGKNRFFTEAGRRGETQFNNTVAMQAKRKGPKYPMLYWTIDGWDVELLYQKTSLNKDGHNVTTYHHRPTIVIILDPFTKYPVGYAIGTHETPELIRQAVRNALRHTEELFGCKYRPQQLQSDRYGNGTLAPFFEAVSKHYTPARVKNAKSKVIEPYFNELNKRHCQFLNNWSGFGVTAKKDNQPNDEYKNKLRHSFPDYNGCVKQLVKIIEQERKAKQEAYITGWQALPDTYQLPWTTEQFLYHAGETKERTSKVRGEGMVFDINRQEYHYESFDTSFRHNMAVDWCIKYDPEDMRHVLAINPDGTIRYLLEEKYIQPMALADRKEGDAGQLSKIDAFNNEMKEQIIEQSAKDYETVQQMFSDNDAINDTLSKMLLVNQLGQHKDQRNERRAMQGAIAANKKKEKQRQISGGKKEASESNPLNQEELNYQYLLEKHSGAIKDFFGT